MKALIDGDIIVYSVGFATEQTTYSVQGMPCIDKKEANLLADHLNVPRDEIEAHTLAEPESHAFHNAKKLINKICETVGADSYEVFLTGHGNYREDAATIQPYKGNRDTSHKPIHYAAIKEYLIKTHGAEVIEGMEADDKLGIEQFNSKENTTCICSIDKDLDMIPGHHYNWRKDEKYFITEEEAMFNFYLQLLTGDQTDNIRGVPQIGKIKANKILDGCKSELCAYNRVRQTYLNYYRKEAEKNNESLSEEELLERSDKDLLENATLLWILREEEGFWTPPTAQEEE